MSPAIARRLLSLFRGSGEPGFSNSRPSPLQTPAAAIGETLSVREHEVLTYLSKGFTVKEIAHLMGIKLISVNDHIKGIYTKLKKARVGAHA